MNNKYSVLEIKVAYALVGLQENLWHEDASNNIFIRTKVGVKILEIIQKNYHCLQENLEIICPQIEHYYYVRSSSMKEYLDANRLLLTIYNCCELLKLKPLNFEAFTFEDDNDTIIKTEQIKKQQETSDEIICDPNSKTNYYLRARKSKVTL